MNRPLLDFLPGYIEYIVKPIFPEPPLYQNRFIIQGIAFHLYGSACRLLTLSMNPWHLFGLQFSIRCSGEVLTSLFEPGSYHFE